MVPNDWQMGNNRAQALINLWSYDQAIAELVLYLAIIGDLAESSGALNPKKRPILGIK